MKAPVALEYAIGKVAESEEEEILLLKVVQSAARRQPKVALLAVLQLNALPLYVRPVPAVVVAPLDTRPPKTARPPSESDGRWSAEVKVEEAIDMRPPVKPVMVLVDTPYAVVSKGKVLASVREPPRARVVPPVKEPVVLMVMLELASWLFPMVEVETTLLEASRARRVPAVRPVSQVEPELVRRVEEALVAKVLEAMREKGVVALSQRAVEVAETVVPA